MSEQDNQQPSSPEETHRVCRKCGIRKPIAAYRLSYNRKYRRRSCQECDRPEFQAKHFEWREKNRDHIRAKARESQRRRIAKMTPEQKRRFDEKMATQANARRFRLKTAVYFKFGGSVCACCGETEPLFLSIDHVKNDGYELRKKGQPRGGEVLHQWLMKHGDPADYQVLCMNCNHGKSRNGGICPHEAEKVQRLSGNGVGPSGPKPPALFCEEVKI